MSTCATAASEVDGAPEGAVRLAALTAEMGAEVHDLRLAGPYLFWGEQDEDEPAVWEWTRYPALAGAKLLRGAGQIELLLDRLADPKVGYVDFGARRATSDLDALDELHQVELAGLLVDGPVRADAEIRYRMDVARADLIRLSMLRADLLREIGGPERGGQARAAAALGIREARVSQIIGRDNERREQIVDAARAAPIDPDGFDRLRPTGIPQ